MKSRNNKMNHGRSTGGLSVVSIPQLDPLVTKILRGPQKHEGRSHSAKLDDKLVTEIRAVIKYTILRSTPICDHYKITMSQFKNLRDWINYADLPEPTRKDVPSWAEEYTYE